MVVLFSAALSFSFSSGFSVSAVVILCQRTKVKVFGCLAIFSRFLDDIVVRLWRVLETELCLVPSSWWGTLKIKMSHWRDDLNDYFKLVDVTEIGWISKFLLSNFPSVFVIGNCRGLLGITWCYPHHFFLSQRLCSIFDTYKFWKFWSIVKNRRVLINAHQNIVKRMRHAVSK